MLRERFEVDADRENGKILFMGDSPNDEPMFGYFENSVAVANFSNFQDSVSKLPRWLTAAGHGAGFVEVADALIEARKSA